MDSKELKNLLADHKKWLDGIVGGVRANLSYADLSGANLRGADLQSADLHSADLRGANLRGADLDFSCWPLWCGTRDVKVDARIFRQLAAHLCAVVVDDEECVDAQAILMPIAAQSHRAEDLLETGKE